MLSVVSINETEVMLHVWLHKPCVGKSKWIGFCHNIKPDFQNDCFFPQTVWYELITTNIFIQKNVWLPTES